MISENYAQIIPGNLKAVDINECLKCRIYEKQIKLKMQKENISGQPSREKQNVYIVMILEL